MSASPAGESFAGTATEPAGLPQLPDLPEPHPARATAMGPAAARTTRGATVGSKLVTVLLGQPIGISAEYYVPAAVLVHRTR